jgi:hypothetical protein
MEHSHLALSFTTEQTVCPRKVVSQSVQDEPLQSAARRRVVPRIPITITANRINILRISRSLPVSTRRRSCRSCIRQDTTLHPTACSRNHLPLLLFLLPHPHQSTCRLHRGNIVGFHQKRRWCMCMRRWSQRKRSARAPSSAIHSRRTLHPSNQPALPDRCRRRRTGKDHPPQISGAFDASFLLLFPFQNLIQRRSPSARRGHPPYVTPR